MGIPPFGGFFSKYLIISGAFQAGHFIIAAMFLFGAVLTILYLFRLFNRVFCGEEKTPVSGEGSPLMLACVASFALLSLIGGIFVKYPDQAIGIIIRQITTGAR